MSNRDKKRKQQAATALEEDSCYYKDEKYSQGALVEMPSKEGAKEVRECVAGRWRAYGTSSESDQ